MLSISMFMIHKLNLKYNIQDAVEYFNILKTDFNYLHWDYLKHHNHPIFIDAKNTIDSVNGWGLQTIYNDPTFPYHPDLDPHDEGPEYFKDTPMVFGFFKKLKDLLKQPFRSFLFNYPPNQKLGKWQASDPAHVSIIIPIIVNQDVCLISNQEKIQTVVLEEGNVYLLDTTKYPAEFQNNSQEEITIIIISVLTEYKQEVLDMTGIV